MRKINVDLEKEVRVVAAGKPVAVLSYKFRRLRGGRRVQMTVHSVGDAGHNIGAFVGVKTIHGIHSAKATIESLPDEVSIVAQHISKVNSRALIPYEGVPFVENPHPTMSSHYRIDRQLP